MSARVRLVVDLPDGDIETTCTDPLATMSERPEDVAERLIAQAVQQVTAALRTRKANR